MRFFGLSIATVLLLGSATTFANIRVGTELSFDLKGDRSDPDRLSWSFTLEDQYYFSGNLVAYYADGTSSNRINAITKAQLKEWDTLVHNCQSSGGVEETITVPAGTFKTCRMTSSENGFSRWFTDQVPAYIVRMKMPDGTYTLELSKFAW